MKFPDFSSGFFLNMKGSARWIIVIFTCFLVRTGFAQPKTQEIPAIDVHMMDLLLRFETLHQQQIVRKEIQRLQPEDVGTLMQRFAGVTVRNYGGLGGMKTISMRGIGGNHTGIIVDGFQVQNTQSGQVDLSTIQVENIENIQFSVQGGIDFLLPVSAHLQGNTLVIHTFENAFSANKTSVRAVAKMGSFGQWDGYGALKFTNQKSYFSVFGRHRQAVGTYPFSFQNGTIPFEGNRMNNDLSEQFGGFAWSRKISSNQFLRVNFTSQFANRGLPGAVILYSPGTEQRLKTDAHQLNLDYRYQKAKFAMRNYISARYDALNYVDSSFLNSQGFLDQTYFQTQIQHGVSLRFLDVKPVFGATLYGGIEQNYAQLNSSIDGFSNPLRYHLKSVFGLAKKQSIFEFKSQLGIEWLTNQTESHSNNQFAFSPSLSLDLHKFYWFGRPSFLLKRNFRMPSFNEMYYNQVGNVDLKPEKANQIGIALEKNVHCKGFNFKLNGNAYYNLVEDKIIAIPTKNVFIWSMQNVGQAQIIGADITAKTTLEFTRLNFDLQGQYAFQHATDRTDRNAQTFGHQLPYLPNHTVTIDGVVSYKNTGFSISSLITSKRYALNQNILANQVDAFNTVDVSVFHTFKMKKNHELRLGFSCKNCFNASYAYVRYFVMPGRNYLLNLSYAL